MPQINMLYVRALKLNFQVRAFASVTAGVRLWYNDCLVDRRLCLSITSWLFILNSS